MEKIWGTSDNSGIDWVSVLRFQKEKEVEEMRKDVSEILDYLLINKKMNPITWEKMKRESRETAEEIYGEIYSVS